MSNKVKKIEETVSEELKQVIKERWDMEKMYYLSIEEKAQNFNGNVMQRYYGISYNNYCPVLLKKTTLDRILIKHGKNGLVCVSANRSGYPQDVNDKNTQRLIIDIKRSGYSYLPIYGGYRSKYTGIKDFEPSFVVFNYTHDGKEKDFEQLRLFALDTCRKYEQHDVMIKYPNAALAWEDGNGNRVSKRSAERYWKNDLTDDTENDGLFECYVNPLPMNLLEEQRRSGEIMIWRV